MTAVSIVAFHGTSSDFDAFTEQSVGRGTDTEPNNRLGVYLTTCPVSASDYAMCASGDDESRATVLAVLFEGKLGPSFFSSSEQFVQGDLHDSMENHVIAQAFRQAHALAQSTADDGEDGDANYDPCEVFTALRASMRESFDALWIENGESPHLVVLNPSCLRIVHKLNNDQASELSDAIAESNIYSFGMEDEHKKCLSMLNGLFGPSLDQLDVTTQSRAREAQAYTATLTDRASIQPN